MAVPSLGALPFHLEGRSWGHGLYKWFPFLVVT